MRKIIKIGLSILFFGMLGAALFLIGGIYIIGKVHEPMYQPMKSNEEHVVNGDIIFRESAYSLSPDCQAVKTGVFKLEDIESGRTYRIERTSTIQTETLMHSGDTSKYNVTWINDCKYELRIIEGREEVFEFYKDKILKIEITETYSDRYSFKAYIDGTNIEFYQTLIKLED